MKKLWKRITAALAGTVLSAMAIMMPAVTSLAVSGVEINESNFPDENFRNEVVKKFDSNNDGYLQDSEIKSVKTIACVKCGITNFKGIEYFTELEDLRCFLNDAPSLDLTKNTKLRHLDAPGMQLTVLSLYNIPAYASLTDDDFKDGMTYWDSEAKYATLSNGAYIGVDRTVKVILTPINEENDDSDWLEPLRTQLRIAADPEFGGNINHTAEYTGDFALPTEIMQYLKDHPDTTLKYSFYVNDVLQTVTISGKDVVIEEGVDWYGFSYLLGHYGNGATAATASGGYTIVNGDTLTSIAAKLGTTVQALAAKNGIKNVDLIYAGSKIAY